MEYLKVWTSFAEIIEPLNDSERGRLFTMMLNYASTGELPEFKGNERYIWPIAKQAIDRARAESDKLTANGSKGGRPKTKDNQTKPNETKENQEKPNETHNNKDKEKEKENIDDDDTARACETPFGKVEIDPVIVMVQKELTGLTQSHYDDLEAFRRDLPDELIEEAVNEAVAHGARSWAYVRTILQAYIRDGIRTVGAARARNEKRRNEPKNGGIKSTGWNYEQRHYTEDELAGRTDDI